MNRYEILTGKVPEEDKEKDYVMGVDVGSGDSTSVWAATQPDGDILFNEDLDRLIENLGDPSVGVTRRDVSPPTFAPPAMVRVQAAENLRAGDLVGSDGQGTIRRIVPGLVPVGIVVQPSDENNEVVMRMCTMDEQLQYTRRIEEANNRAQSSAAMARRYAEASAEEQIVPERDRSEALFRLAEQMGMVEAEAPSMGHYFQEVRGVSGATGAHSSHRGTLHEHPRMQQQLKIPQDHVIVDRNEWQRARQRRGNR
jgi:hypothetical protein